MDFIDSYFRFQKSKWREEEEWQQGPVRTPSHRDPQTQITMETGSRKRKLSSDITENPQKLQQTPSHRDPQTQITMETGSRKRKLSSDITENPQKLQQTPSHRDPQTQIAVETGSQKRKLSSDITENRQKLQQAFWSMPSDHPIWICLLPYLSTEDKLVLRDVNRNCQDIMDSAFSKALTITVPSDTPSEMIKIVMENNRCVRNLTAQHCKTVQDIVAWFPYQVRLVRVDLSHSVFTSVEYAVDTLVDCCRQLEKVCLQNLTENEYPLAVRSKQWPFHGLLRNPLPRLQHLDISGNGSRWLSPSMFASLIEKHPRLHTLSVDCGVLMSWLRRVQRIHDLMDLRHFFTTEEDYRDYRSLLVLGKVGSPQGTKLHDVMRAVVILMNTVRGERAQQHPLLISDSYMVTLTTKN
ncbi:uncharacterized protein LOC143275083 [Babylonia areolata]|uniref:uncharacterized protein LOC143275083 n=1 Tax=Babylonia areolata TaxID=304850 RepID=UPI003FCFF742